MKPNWDKLTEARNPPINRRDITGADIGRTINDWVPSINHSLQVLQGNCHDDRVQENRRIIRDGLRRVQGFVGTHPMEPFNKTPTHYYEENIGRQASTLEHLLPVKEVVVLLVQGVLNLPLAICSPTVKLTKKSELLLNKTVNGVNLRKQSPDVKFPFKRYAEAGITSKIFTNSGIEVDFNTWTLEDHYKMMVEELNIINFEMNK